MKPSDCSSMSWVSLLKRLRSTVSLSVHCHAGLGANTCRTSCPDCLRDFSNLPYHPILDWRLGLDIARLALDPAAPIDFSVTYWQGLDAAVAGPYFAAMPGWQQTTIAGLQAGTSRQYCGDHYPSFYGTATRTGFGPDLTGCPRASRSERQSGSIQVAVRGVEKAILDGLASV